VHNGKAKGQCPQQTLINDGDYMTDEKTQQPLGVASDLNAELDCCFTQIIQTLKDYNATSIFNVPETIKNGFIDFVETNHELHLGGFFDGKTHCAVSFNKKTGEIKKFHNGVAI
jgi:hypothetical protein